MCFVQRHVTLNQKNLVTIFVATFSKLFEVLNRFCTDNTLSYLVCHNLFKPRFVLVIQLTSRVNHCMKNLPINLDGKHWLNFKC